MTVIHGHIENGQVVADEPIPSNSERQEVEIKILDTPVYPAISDDEIQQKLERGRRQQENGQTLSMEEVKKRVAQKLS